MVLCNILLKNIIHLENTISFSNNIIHCMNLYDIIRYVYKYTSIHNIPFKSV